MTDDDKLIETISQAINYVWLQKEARDRLAESIITDLRAAGWLLIPPLDTPDGQAAVERACSAWFGAGNWETAYAKPIVDVDRSLSMATTFRRDVSNALRAAGGSHE